jgi:hypothetical protein
MKHLIINLFFISFVAIASAQISSKPDLKNLISTVNEFNERQSLEKLYLQTDKPDYMVGDTLWFKAYLFDATYFTAAPKSGLMYIEIANDSNKLMKRIMLPIISGLSMGQIVLDSTLTPKGSYILRAYTNWMQNFGEDYIFKKQFYIGSMAGTEWLVNYHTDLKKEEGKDKAELNLKFSRLDKMHVALKDLQLVATDGKRNWGKAKVQTDIDGTLKVNLDLPEKVDAARMSLHLQDLSKNAAHGKLNVPLILNRPDHIDLQFMPEGGDLIADIPGFVAFKAINEDGRGVNISGKIYDSKGQEVATFNAVHKGVGSFYLRPMSAEVYSARLNLPDGTTKTYALPPVKTSGISLSVRNPLEHDSCEVVVRGTPDLIAAGQSYFLVGQARGVVCFAGLMNIKKEGARLKIHKKEFPAGIVRIILAGTDHKVRNERLIFVDHADQLNIRLDADKAVYRQRDSVVMHINVTDKDGNPVQGDFSMAVTDDNQVKIDTMGSGSILSHMLLTTELKGRVEDPGYYLQAGTNTERWQHLDQLLLAQGWVGYNWNDIFKPLKSPFAFEAEPRFEIRGKVSNVFNKAVSNTGINLFSKRPLVVIDTVTDEKGSFTFKDIFPVDTATFFIQARNKRGKSFNVGIEMEEFKPPVFAEISQRMIPWYVNIDTGRWSAAKKQFLLINEVNRITGRNMLREVAITAKKVIKDSKNLNGPGEADLIIDQEDLERMGRMTLGELLEKRLKGFMVRFNREGNRYYVLKDMAMHLIIDGIDVKYGNPEGISQYEYMKEFFDYYDAENIKGIEVMTSSKYQMKYSTEYGEFADKPWEHAYIEVTTRSGQGPFFKKTVGTYLYKPLPFSSAKKFYAPKYSSGSTADMTDIRSTIHWAPYIVTDKNGMATVTFYTADNPGSYSLILEGADMKGNFGTKTSLLKVEK